VVDFSKLTRDQAAGVIEVTVDDFLDGRGENPARSVELDSSSPISLRRFTGFKLADKLEALHWLGKHHKLWVDRVQHEGAGIAERLAVSGRNRGRADINCVKRVRPIYPSWWSRFNGWWLPSPRGGVYRPHVSIPHVSIPHIGSYPHTTGLYRPHGAYRHLFYRGPFGYRPLPNPSTAVGGRGESGGVLTSTCANQRSAMVWSPGEQTWRQGLVCE
jgi:hypothetical protein